MGLEEHSLMLGRIANLVAPLMPENSEMTTFEAVKHLIEDRENETLWANHYLRRLVEAQRLGYLPDDFKI
jgi:hypothetical protein